MSKSKYVTCPDCDGSGFTDEDGNSCNSNHDSAEECVTCGGRGEYLEGDE